MRPCRPDGYTLGIILASYVSMFFHRSYLCCCTSFVSIARYWKRHRAGWDPTKRPSSVHTHRRVCAMREYVVYTVIHHTLELYYVSYKMYRAYVLWANSKLSPSVDTYCVWDTKTIKESGWLIEILNVIQKTIYTCGAYLPLPLYLFPGTAACIFFVVFLSYENRILETKQYCIDHLVASSRTNAQFRIFIQEKLCASKIKCMHII